MNLAGWWDGAQIKIRLKQHIFDIKSITDISMTTY